MLISSTVTYIQKKYFWEKKRKFGNCYQKYSCSFFFSFITLLIDARRVVYVPSQHLLSWIINFVYVQMALSSLDPPAKPSVMGMSLAYDVYIRHDLQQVGWLGLNTKSRLFYNITQQKIQAPS